MKMGRFLLVSAAVLGFLTAQADARVLKLGHSATEANPRHAAALLFAERVKALSNDKLTVAVGSNAQFGDDQEMATALRLGTLDISIGSIGSFGSIVPEGVTIGLPFLFDDVQAAWRVLDGPVGEELARKAAAKQLIVLGFWDNGIRHITNNVRPIREPADLKGLKIRVPPDQMAIDIFTALGANPTPIKFSELYLALQQGVVDGQENPMVNIWSQKFQEVQKYLSLARHKYEYLPFLASKATWDTLSAEDKDVIRKAAAEATTYQRKVMLEADVKYAAEIKAAGVAFNEIDTAAFRKATQSVYQKWQASNGEFVTKLVEAAQKASK